MISHYKTLSASLIVFLSLLVSGCASSGNSKRSPGAYPEWVSAMGANTLSDGDTAVTYANGQTEAPPDRNKDEDIPPAPEQLKASLKVLFDINQSEIGSQYLEHLRKFAKIMTDNPSIKISIEGHTCNIGSERYNIELSRKRAESVKSHLISRYGIDPSRMTIAARGGSEPVAGNEKESDRKENRRAVADLAITSEPKKQGPSPLMFDLINEPLNGLTDYSKPDKKIVPGENKPKKEPVEAKANPWSFLGDTKQGDPKKTGTWSGWGGNENINILVNKPDEKDKPEKATEATEPLSRIEERYNKYGDLTKGKKIKQFGYYQIRLALQARKEDGGAGMDFIREKKGAVLFSQDETTRLFSESKDDNSRYYSKEYTSMRPVSADYIIAPGDEVFVKITGPVEIAEVFAVDRNGQLFIPKIGAINIGGRKASELQRLIHDKAKTVFVNPTVEASMGRMRSIEVTVTGYVGHPGLLQVAANSSLLSALAASGGPTKDGTLRNVLLRRKSGPDLRIDLYRILMPDGGKQDNNPASPTDPILLPGDEIHVGPIGNTVAVLSPDDHGGIYEILAATSLKELVSRVGLTDNFTDIETVLIERNAKRFDRKIDVVDFKRQAGSFALSDGDIFQFFPTYPHARNVVSVNGPVLRPGTYPTAPGMRISDLLRLSKGFLVNCSLDSALLIRELGSENRFNIMPGDNRGSHRNQLIWVDLAKIISGDKEADLPLVRLDRLKIFTMDEQQPDPMVKIIGGVRNPGEYHLTSGMTLGDLLSIAGGPSEKAYDGESSIVRRRLSRDGMRHFDVDIIPFNLKEAMGDQKSSRIILENQDQIVIRQVNNLEIKANIEGWVQFPGTYILPSGSRIQDLVKLAGGILQGADLRASVFTRKRVANVQNQRLNGFYANSAERFARNRDEVTLSGRPSESLATQLSLLGQEQLYLNMKEFQTSGRVVIDLTSQDFPKTDDNLVLEDGDALTIPQRMTTVMVMGRIFNPSAYLWKEGLSVEDYLNKSGGWLDDADPENFYMVMSNGEIRSAAQRGGRSKLLSMNPGPGDIIFIPQKPLGRSTMSQIMDVLQILKFAAETGAIGTLIPNIDRVSPTIDVGGGQRDQRTVHEEYPSGLYDPKTKNQ